MIRSALSAPAFRLFRNPVVVACLASLALSSACNRGAEPAPEPAAVPPAVAPSPRPQEPVAAPAAPPEPAAAAPATSAPSLGASAATVAPLIAASGAVGADAKAAAGSTKQLVRGASAKDEPFEAWLEADAPLTANGKAELRLVLEAKGPYKCNDSYPYKFKVASSSGVSVADPAVKGMQIGKKRSTMPIPVSVGAAGRATLSGELSFSVCTEDKCLIEKQTLSISVDVSS